jgi:multiple sugar transport system ATP-binding protein
MIVQNYSLYPSFTVYENLAYPLKMQHVPREKIDEAVNEMAELLELTELLHRQPSELSGGQSQRVAIGRALVRKPKLFLMDEPFSNLDINMRRKLRMELRSLNKKLGITFIYVTHDQPEAFMLGDRVVVLHDGITEQIGTPQELYTKPKNMYVASFIGSPQMNFIENVPITSSENGLSVTVLGKTLPLPDKMTAALSKESGGKNVTLGVRPVHVTPSNEGIDAVVDYVDTVEAELHIHASVGKIKFVSIIPATSASTYMRGENIKLSIDANKIHLFDPETGERIN